MRFASLKLNFLLINIVPALTLFLNLNARSSEIKFHHLTINQGLSQNSINFIVQDDRGFIWIGTQIGLNRYDGYSFRAYENNPRDTNSLSNNFITSICKDSIGNFWIGTYNGFNKFDIKTERFTQYKHDPNNPQSISSSRIKTICLDKTGMLWIGTEDGLNRFDPKKRAFSHFKADSTNDNGINDNMIQTIYSDRSGILWIGTFNGGLNRYDHQMNQFSHFIHQPDDSTSLSNNSVLSILEDHSGTLWIGTEGGGLNKFDREKGIFISFQNIPGDPTSISDNHISYLCEERSGNLWIGTNNSGLNIFNQQTATFTRILEDPYNPRGLNYSRIKTIFEDQSGGIWVGTSGGGINIFQKNIQQFNHYKHDPDNTNSLNDNVVWGMYEDQHSILWIGTDFGGLNKFDRKNNTFTHYTYDPDNKESISCNRVLAICEDNNSALWVGTNGGGLNKFDRDTEQFTHFTHNPDDPLSLSNDKVICLFKDPSGTLWIGTKGGGLNKFDEKTEEFTSFAYNPKNPYSLSNNKVYAITEHDENSLWIGTFGGGLNRFYKTNGQCIQYLSDTGNVNSLSDDFIISLYKDTSGHLWIGTLNKGLNKFDLEKKTFTHITKDDGLPDNAIYHILEDSRGFLWVSTNKGIARYNPKTNTSKNYDIQDGLQNNEFNFGAGCKTKGGEIFFGGLNGFNRFFPDSIIDNPSVPPIEISDFRIFNRSVPIGKMADGRTLLNKSITETDAITLSYRDNVFSFAFTALNYVIPEKNNYAYMLEGLEKEWNYVDSERRNVTYSGIAPGKYTFKVKGSNNDGIWNESGTSIKLTIIPPFWDTVLFKFFILALIIGIVTYFYKMRTTSIRQTMAKQKLETELKLKANFTAMLVHDLRSPLHCVLGYTDMIQNKGKHQDEARMGNIVKKSINMMIELINNMLDISKFEADKMIIKKEDIVINDLLIDIVNLMEPLFIEKNLQLEREVETTTTIQADEVRISRVINNFLSNAVKFSPEDETIIVTIKKVQIRGRWHQEFSVFDKGFGVQQSKQSHLFNAYAQVEDINGALPIGTGLGLAVSKLIIESHMGKIGYRPGNNGGSEFYFQLPE